MFYDNLLFENTIQSEKVTLFFGIEILRKKQKVITTKTDWNILTFNTNKK